MQDRVSLYPGRVKLTPVVGQENTFDLVRADQPTQEGTPLNKANLLTDETASLFNLGQDAVPNEVLAAIKSLIDSARASADSKAKIAVGSYKGTQKSGEKNPCKLTFDFPPKYLLVTNSSGNLFLFIISGRTRTYAIYDNSYLAFAKSSPNTFTFSGNTVSWYCDNAEYQLNYYDQYYYAAIG